MKKVLIVVMLSLFVFASPAFAVDTWYKTLSGTVAWEAATYEDGSPFELPDIATYNVYAKNITTGVVTKIGSTPELALAIVIPNRGRYRVGVEAQLSEDEKSVVVWSDDAAACSSAGTFGFRLMFPTSPKNIRKQ